MYKLFNPGENENTNLSEVGSQEVDQYRLLQTFQSQFNEFTQQPSEKSMKKYVCSTCSKGYGRPDHLKRHQTFECGQSAKRFSCDVCHKAFKRKDHLKQHKSIHVFPNNAFNI